MIKKLIKRNKRGNSVFVLIVLSAMAFGAVCFSLTPSALALDELELDANVCSDGGDDWSTVFPEYVDGCPVVSGSGAYENTGRIPDPDDPTTSYFKTGSSKDIQEVGDWDGSGNSAPPKDEITNAYAAAYIDGSDLIIYFGLDRYANNGSSTVGFWFFRDDVSYNETTKKFSGNHEIGDILVVSDFTQGGAVGSILVFEWVGDKNGDSTSVTKPPAGGGDGPLQLLLIEESFDGAEEGVLVCDNMADPEVCAIVNSGETPAWDDYSPKFGTDASFPHGSFFEGGLNVTQLIGHSTCFSSFMAETRASTEPTATLKDFIVHEFKICGIEVSKECTEIILDEIDRETFLTTYEIEISNTGIGTIYDVTLEELNTDDLDQEGEQCEITAINGVPLSETEYIDISVPYEVFGELDDIKTVTVVCDTFDNPYANSVGVTAGSTDEMEEADLDDTATDACESLAVDSTILLEKTCDDLNLVPLCVIDDTCSTEPSPYVIQVSNTIVVKNDGDEISEALTNITVLDDTITELELTGGSAGSGWGAVTCGCEEDPTAYENASIACTCDAFLTPGEYLEFTGSWVATGIDVEDVVMYGEIQAIQFSNQARALAVGSVNTTHVYDTLWIGEDEDNICELCEDCDAEGCAEECAD